MSAYLDSQVGDPYYTDSVGSIGPQTDGTYSTPVVSNAVTPYDAGGGPAANYGPQVIDFFKWGTATVLNQKNQVAQLDYKRWEATQAGLYQQGRPANMYTNANGGPTGQLIMFALIIGGVILLAKG
jgi:hypothetical protein